MKQVFIFAVALIFCTVCSYAQPVEVEEGNKPPRQKTNIKKQNAKLNAKPIPVLFQANHDFYLFIDGKMHGKVQKDDVKNINLQPGVYKLVFEEADSTGEFIEQMFRVTSEVSKQKDSIYKVSFRNDFIDIMNSLSVNPTETNLLPVLNEQEKKQLEVINTIEKDMVPIPGGSYKTSSSEAKDAATLVITVKPLLFGKYEITQQQWIRIMGQNRSRHENCSECPVESVSWADVDSFIRKINRISGKQFRLPSEAEWEYVTQKVVGETMKDFISDRDHYNKQWTSVLENTAWHAGNSRKTTREVGKKKDLFDIYDLFGNVAEWCADYYQPNKTNDSQGPATGTRKVIKGGSYLDDAEKFGAGKRDSENRFRLVMDAGH
jgi:formylglycine-generating enzyme required for sulfatase activity